MAGVPEVDRLRKKRQRTRGRISIPSSLGLAGTEATAGLLMNFEPGRKDLFQGKTRYCDSIAQTARRNEHLQAWFQLTAFQRLDAKSESHIHPVADADP